MVTRPKVILHKELWIQLQINTLNCSTHLNIVRFSKYSSPGLRIALQTLLRGKRTIIVPLMPRQAKKIHLGTFIHSLNCAYSLPTPLVHLWVYSSHPLSSPVGILIPSLEFTCGYIHPIPWDHLWVYLSHSLNSTVCHTHPTPWVHLWVYSSHPLSSPVCILIPSLELTCGYIHPIPWVQLWVRIIQFLSSHVGILIPYLEPWVHLWLYSSHPMSSHVDILIPTLEFNCG